MENSTTDKKTCVEGSLENILCFKATNETDFVIKLK